MQIWDLDSIVDEDIKVREYLQEDIILSSSRPPAGLCYLLPFLIQASYYYSLQVLRIHLYYGVFRRIIKNCDVHGFYFHITPAGRLLILFSFYRLSSTLDKKENLGMELPRYFLKFLYLSLRTRKTIATFVKALHWKVEQRLQVQGYIGRQSNGLHRQCNYVSSFKSDYYFIAEFDGFVPFRFLYNE